MLESNFTVIVRVFWLVALVLTFSSVVLTLFLLLSSMIVVVLKASVIKHHDFCEILINGSILNESKGAELIVRYLWKS